jgi:hypothetical protein
LTVQKRFIPALMSGFLCLLAAACSGTRTQDIDDAEPEEKVWRETSHEFPAFPRDENLVPIQMQGIGGAREYLVDTKSLSSDADGVVRYTVVIRTPSGGLNVIFEGLRCDTLEYKAYAFATRAGEFKPLDRLSWKKVLTGGPGHYRVVLLDRYMCDENKWSLKLKEIVARFEYGPPVIESSVYGQ